MSNLSVYKRLQTLINVSYANANIYHTNTPLISYLLCLHQIRYEIGCNHFTKTFYYEKFKKQYSAYW